MISGFQEQENDITDLSSTLDRLNTLERVLSDARSDLLTNSNTQKTSIEEIEGIQQETKKTLDATQTEKDQLEKGIASTQMEIERVQGRIVETKTFLTKTFVEGYKNDRYAKTDLILSSLIFGKTLGVTFSESDTSDTLLNTTEDLLVREKSLEDNLGDLQKSLAKKMQQKNHVLERLANYADVLTQTRLGENALISGNTAKNQNLRDNMREVVAKKQTVIAKIQQEKVVASAQIQQKFSDYETALKQSFAQYDCANQRWIVCQWMDQYIALEKEMLTNPKNTMQFVWPVSANNGFGTTFRDQAYYVAHNSHHEGLDIITPSWVPVKALADGYLLIKQYPRGNSPGVVILKHPGGYMSIYVGIAPSQQEMFSRVTAGDVIGTTRNYTEESNQNILHVEFFESGKATDILEKLDLSGLAPEKIPARYGWKYIDDLRKAQKPVNISDLQKTIGFFFIDGATEADRQTNFLATYAADSYKDRNLWVEESLPESVDPTFVMCVGLAESSLGKNLTTDGNVGNVGNTDSGKRQDYDTTRTGIHAISAVVNNAWLGSYTTIDQLSSWGNTTGPIYASSHTNWHENVIKCMSALKEQYVWNKANFRLTQAGLLLYQQEGFMLNKSS